MPRAASFARSNRPGQAKRFWGQATFGLRNRRASVARRQAPPRRYPAISHANTPCMQFVGSVPFAMLTTIKPILIFFSTVGGTWPRMTSRDSIPIRASRSGVLLGKCGVKMRRWMICREHAQLHVADPMQCGHDAGVVQWLHFGNAMRRRRIQARALPRERKSPKWRGLVFFALRNSIFSIHYH